MPQHIADPNGGVEGHCIATDGRGGVVRDEKGEKLADVPARGPDGTPIWGACVIHD